MAQLMPILVELKMRQIAMSEALHGRLWEESPQKDSAENILNRRCRCSRFRREAPEVFTAFHSSEYVHRSRSAPVLGIPHRQTLLAKSQSHRLKPEPACRCLYGQMEVNLQSQTGRYDFLPCL